MALNSNFSEAEAIRSLQGQNYWYNSVSGGNQLVKTGPTYVHSVTIGNSPLTSAFAMYDGTTSAGTLFFKLNTSVSAQTFTPDVNLVTGLVISAGSLLDNITVSYQ